MRWFVGEGHGPPATPTPPRFPGWPPCFPCSVGRAFTPAAPWQFQNWGLGITTGSGGVRAPRPTAAREGCLSRLAGRLPWFVGEGHGPPAGVRGAAGSPGTISGLRAGPCGPVGLRNAPAGAVRASSPTEVCYNAGPAVFPVGCRPSVGRRGGIYPSRGCLRRGGVPGPIWNQPLQRLPKRGVCVLPVAPRQKVRRPWLGWAAVFIVILLRRGYSSSAYRPPCTLRAMKCS